MGPSSLCVGVVGGVLVTRCGVHEDVRAPSVSGRGLAHLAERRRYGSRGGFEDEADVRPHVDPRRPAIDSVSGLHRALRAALSYAAKGSQKLGEFALIFDI